MFSPMMPFRNDHTQTIMMIQLNRFDPRSVQSHFIKGVVSKETVVLRRWGSCIKKIGFIKGVDNVN